MINFPMHVVTINNGGIQSTAVDFQVTTRM
jgi:hypothetical protein